MPAVEAAGDDPPPNRVRPPTRYLWALLLARLNAACPVTCPPCGAEMRIIVFIMEVLGFHVVT